MGEGGGFIWIREKEAIQLGLERGEVDPWSCCDFSLGIICHCNLVYCSFPGMCKLNEIVN